MMASKKLLFTFLSLLIFSLLSGQGSAGHFHIHPTKLIVFGDSYVDTGNINVNTSGARNFPYGITFPGVPSGRFSDGRVLTDFFAKYLGLKKSPTPFIAWQKIGNKRPKFGINFAFGGTGVFDTSFPFPNMTTQINLFQNLIANSIFTSYDIHSSIALVSPSGNDYSFYLATNGSPQGFKPFVISVVNQIAVNLKRIYRLGVKKIVVVGLGPVGCYPQLTAPSFNKCNATMNSFVEFHNILLKKAVEKLNNETKGSPNFFILDMYDTVLSIIQNKGNPKVGVSFKTPLKPCCFGVSSEFSCGSVDEHGNKMYTLCKHPNLALFWDSLHPTQKGWFAAFSSLRSNLKHL
ncbi:GDSL esterase/lipase At5g03610-like [Benincasa hispida]|uniref:GDSL esterase/lipase At5g03610-like n=1 Tax=Benincasa hispida TaxID=102211 RepID=UPI0018FF9D70|nr:GDSL esterase/lipase At5g03610-like [Benincasa hispida]